MSENAPVTSNGISFDGKTYFHFNFRISYRLIVLFSLLLYLLWEIYWARKVGYAFIKWHTHLAIYIYGGLIGWFLLHVLNRLFSLGNYVKYKTVLLSITFTLVLLETFLYATGVGDTYMEKIKFGYRSRYNAAFESYYRIHKPREKFYISRPEFNYLRQCNSLGFSDIEWPRTKMANEKRILFGGDSFTEGVGAPFDSCYVSVLRTLLLSEDSNNFVMNSGISGDDPAINFVAYRDLLAAYHPDLVVQTLSSNDINTDIAVKGGLERFQKDGTIKFPTPPWWEPIYALSYVSRTFFTAAGYNELLLKIPFTPEEKEKLDQKTLDVFTAYAQVAKKNGARLLVILQPYEGEIFNKEYEYDLSAIAKHLHQLDNLTVHDLMPFYLHEFEKNKDDIRSYYWEQDGHHNAKGYHLMARGIQQAVDSMGLK